MKNHVGLLICGILTLVVVAVAMALIVPNYKEMRDSEARLIRKNEEKNRKINEVFKAKKKVKDLREDPKTVESVARKKFNMSKDGEVVMTYTEEKKPEQPK